MKKSTLENIKKSNSAPKPQRFKRTKITISKPEILEDRYTKHEMLLWLRKLMDENKSVRTKKDCLVFISLLIDLAEEKKTEKIEVFEKFHPKEEENA